MKRTLLTIFSILSLTIGTLSAQTTEEFKPSGSPEVLLFTDFNYSTTNGKSYGKFEITRAYFGYKYNFSQTFSGRVTLDVGNPGVGGLNYTAYIKYGYLQYQKKNLTAKFGLIQNTMYEMLENYWGSRYVYKVFQDQYGFAASADFGLSAAYNFNKAISADAMVSNGGGYKILNADSVLKKGIGVTIHPVKGITFRGYYDNMKKVNSSVTQNSASLMAGYENKTFKIAAEYNNQTNNKLLKGNDWNGYSLSGKLFLNAKTDLFVRYDQLHSVNNTIKPTSWNYSKDGQAVLFGLEFIPVKGVRISPNYQLWTPRDGAKAATSSVFMNVEIKI
jgi:hypothetical protein